jgi:septum formation protein
MGYWAPLFQAGKPDRLTVMLLLASASPARRRLLEQAAIPHRVQVSGVDEDGIVAADPQELVRLLAQAKAQAVFLTLVPAQQTVVLGCDSLLVFDGEVFGKPADTQEAIHRWQRMAGGWGELHTGHCLLAPGTIDGGAKGPPLVASRLETVTTRVQFAALSTSEIEAYVATGEPLHCAGGFALEGVGGQVVERIEGCFSNVIGLSLPLLRRWLAPQL